jgi:hypothetical protein
MDLEILAAKLTPKRVITENDPRFDWGGDDEVEDPADSPGDPGDQPN